MGKKLRSQRRGKGGPNYRSPSFRHLAPGRHPSVREAKGKVIDILHAPGRSTPFMKVSFEGKEEFMIAAEGSFVGQEIAVGQGAVLESGNVMPVGNVPEGVQVYNLELRPGDGGKLVKTAGTAATVISHGEHTTVQLPSGSFKRLDNRCYASVGVPAGGGRSDKPFAKSGKKFYAMSSKARDYLHVSGVAMNPINHPFGGGSHQHVGRPSTVGRGRRPGQKVGRLSPKKKSRRGR